MSANPAHYNAADHLRFEQYAGALRNAGAGLGPCPGLPPDGYRQSFCLGNKYAPLPEHYPQLFFAGQNHASAQRTGLGEVSMSESAFGNMLSVIQVAHSNAHAQNPGPAYYNRGSTDVEMEAENNVVTPDDVPEEGEYEEEEDNGFNADQAN
ncbi:hypothetical protein DFH08DRAFT_971228 [Mycena albidolilacea]|uniref:Uncharacterized protein n=1 Tax=Mycena albidolilacea TaxID=1033008 RepID=A0AAD7EEQ8_9AGAR|nr:hypothetical protein DFH08DRAFT_971228 [Mycena albidolilacea]